MINNQWYIVLESKEVKKKAVGVIRFGERLIFYRDISGKIHCLFDQCAHRGAKLSFGKVIGDVVQCPFHGLEFDKDGKCVKIPANGNNTPVDGRFKVKSYPVYENFGWIWVYYSKENSSPCDLPEYFNNIDNSLAAYTWKKNWKMHYSRCIENQLDVSHVPFVHYNTIGRGFRTL
ncbi:MAG TPA: aromatic ring-hydroxylating dioxygenase subunit alpha, partial [Spirochaetota bacterium]|nr:aromatic ring-hydroxylating dioxygenase subunit alpha [Spirochaetota bacterium]